MIGGSGRAGGRHRALVRILSVGGAVLVALSAVACGTEPPRNAVVEPRAISAEDFDMRNFGDAAQVDNVWFPLTPGTRFAYKGSSIDDGERISHAVVTTVTDLTKVIDGVRTTVVWERDYTEGELEEAEIAFFAQDNDGNVWHMGEYPEEYADGKVVKAPAWLAGLEGATAGIVMMAEPRRGAPSYAQGYAPRPINWADRGRVYRTDQRTCVPVACYRDVLVTEEFERAKPGAFQLKFYAPGVGNVRVGWRGAKETEREVLELVNLVHLSPKALAEARADALELERRAYVIRKDLYGQTRPAEGP